MKESENKNEIFNENISKHVISCARFEDFIQKISSTKITMAIFELPWDDYQQAFYNIIIKSFHEFKNTAPCANPNTAIPPTGLKGVYFCLGDDGLSFCIGGSLYSNETDWAANAEFYPKDAYSADDILNSINDKLISLKIKETEISYLLFTFSAFTICKLMPKIEHIAEIANAVISLGYSDGGDEFVLGKFEANKFNLNIKIIANGHYEQESTAIPYIVKIEPREKYWHYLTHNYWSLIKEHGLLDQLMIGGEVEAEKIYNKFKDRIFINICQKCGSFKKTPRARLCLHCRDFT